MSNSAPRYVMDGLERSEWSVDGSPAPATGGGTPSLPVEIDPSAEDVMETLVGLGPRDLTTYRALCASPGSTTQELADELDLHRSNVSRSLTTLVEAGLATRRRRILTSGGHVYEYAACPREELYARLQAALDEWRATAADSLDAFVAGLDAADPEGEVRGA